MGSNRKPRTEREEKPRTEDVRISHPGPNGGQVVEKPTNGTPAQTIESELDTNNPNSSQSER